MKDNVSDIRLTTTNLTPEGHLPLDRLNASLSIPLAKWSGSGHDILGAMIDQSTRFDVIIASRSMSSIYGIPYGDFLNRCAQVLRPNGVLVSDVFTTNMHNLLNAMYPNNDHSHNSYYDEDTLRKHLRLCRFSRAYCTNYCHVPGMIRYSGGDSNSREALTQNLQDQGLLETPTHIQFLAVKS